MTSKKWKYTTPRLQGFSEMTAIANCIANGNQAASGYCQSMGYSPQVQCLSGQRAKQNVNCGSGTTPGAYCSTGTNAGGVSGACNEGTYPQCACRTGSSKDGGCRTGISFSCWNGGSIC